MPSISVQLTEDHIQYIIRDLHYRGIVLEDFENELIDHICSSVEDEMRTGKKFIDAYQIVLKTFGHTSGLRKTQKQIISSTTNPATMLKSYLLIALRNHMKNKFYSIINVAGLAVGIASCLVILLFVVHEISYDGYNKKADNIYRVNTEIKVGAVHHHLALASTSVAEIFRQSYPEIESTLRMWNWGHRFVHLPETEERFRENIVWADSTFFRFFSIPVLQGDAHTALKEANTIAISKTTADKYFPDGNAIGKSLVVDDNLNYMVTAVYQDIPENSHFHFDLIRSITGLEDAKSVSLIGGAELNLYLLLRDGADPHQLEEKFPQFVEKYVAPQLAYVIKNDFSMEKFQSEGNKWRYWLTPLTDIHLHSDMNGDMEGNGNITYVYLFSAIAFFILIVACINFMNLSTARSASRAREVGIRKVMGSLRGHLIRQFLTESFILSLTSFVLALALAYLFLPVFNNLALKNLSLPLNQFSFYLVLLAAALFVGTMAGLYPSFFLSSFSPSNVLKGNVTKGGRSGFIRSGLVVFQFVISILLIVGTITVQRQLSYIQNKKIGFQKDQVVIVHEAHFLDKQVQSFRDEVLTHSAITAGTISGYLPVSRSWRNFTTFWPEGKAPTGADVKDMLTVQQWQVDYDYLKTMGMKIKLGRNFSPDFLSDSTESVILNESAITQLELESDPLGKKISTFGGTNADGTPDPITIKTWTIIGVVENFHFESLRENIAPLGFFLSHSNGFVSFRFESADTQTVLSNIENTWKKMAPGHAFEYSFLNDDFGKMYDAEQRLGKIFALFAGLAVLIACLGLFALTAFTAEQRNKEIGIRKTLGASVNSIIILLSRDYGKLILIAFVITTPLAWYGINWWLESYSYKADVGVTVYAMAGMIALLIALLTVGYQSIRAAMMNPIDSLRSE